MRNVDAACARRKDMVALFVAGSTLQEIADRYGITRQRVQCLLKREGVDRQSGGHHGYRWARYGFSSAKEFDDACVRYPDCVEKFRQHLANAKARDIEFSFTLKTWLGVWDGRWNDRGRGEGLVMCRYNDEGPYSPENVYIATAGQNTADYQNRRWHGLRVDVDSLGIASTCMIRNTEIENSESSSKGL